jgi:hypothetical protein
VCYKTVATYSISIFYICYLQFSLKKIILYIYFLSNNISKSRPLYSNTYIKDIFLFFCIYVFVIRSNILYIFSFAKPVI